jgi:hypothetical protein
MDSDSAQKVPDQHKNDQNQGKCPKEEEHFAKSKEGKPKSDEGIKRRGKKGLLISE